jgi:hypothetical protein
MPRSCMAGLNPVSWKICFSSAVDFRLPLASSSMGYWRRKARNRAPTSSSVTTTWCRSASSSMSFWFIRSRRAWDWTKGLRASGLACLP